MRRTRSGRLVTAAFLVLIGILAAVTLTGCMTEGTGTPVISDPQPTALERDPRHTDAPEPGEIRINEVMASNKATVADEEGFIAHGNVSFTFGEIYLVHVIGALERAGSDFSHR